MGRRFSAQIHLKSPFDSANARLQVSILTKNNSYVIIRKTYISSFISHLFSGEIWRFGGTFRSIDFLGELPICFRRHLLINEYFSIDPILTFTEVTCMIFYDWYSAFIFFWEITLNEYNIKALNWSLRLRQYTEKRADCLRRCCHLLAASLKRLRGWPLSPKNGDFSRNFLTDEY